MSHKNDLSTTSEFQLNRQRKRGFATWQKVLLTLFIIICVLLIAVFGTVVYYKNIYRPTINEDLPDVVSPEYVPETPEGTSAAEPLLTRKNNCYTFLVIGCDRKEWLSDVIMIARYDVAEKTCSLMQIPRDTYVTLSNKLYFDEDGSLSPKNFAASNGYGCKINSALGHAGSFAESEFDRIIKSSSGATDTDIQALLDESFLDVDLAFVKNYLASTPEKKTEILYQVKSAFAIKYLCALLSNSFGTPVDFYARLNLDGFVNIVDAIGGVDVYVQEDMDYDDPYQDLHIHIKKGNKHLNGKDAEGFIRFRYGYAAADIARIDAQKIFMTAFIKKVLSLDGILNLNDMATELSKNLETNLSVSDILYFVTNALDVKMDEVVMLTMPGSAKYKNDISYYSIDKATMMQYVNTYLNKYTTDLDERYFYAVEIAAGDTSTAPLTAADITETQPDLGFMR